MTYEIVSVLAFCLYFIYDINSVIWKKQILHGGFFVGTALIIVVTAKMICDAYSHYSVNRLLILVAVIFVGLLIYSLFLEIPFKKTYLGSPEKNVEVGNIGNKNIAYKKGTYALCRHPGVLWFVGLYLCICIEFPSFDVIANSILLIALDIFYVVFQDKWTFVKTFEDYEEYKKDTPFLIPNKESIKMCLQSMKG